MSGYQFDLEELSGIGRERANDLRAAGFDTIAAIQRASVTELATVTGISERLAAQMKEELADEGEDRRRESMWDEEPLSGTARFAHVSSENRHLASLISKREWLRRFRPGDLDHVLFRPCQVDVLLVADGILQFNTGDFGLQAFVETLLQPPGPYVRFNVTLAHRGFGQFSQILRDHSRVKRVISQFRFDDSTHFDPETFDQVWLFGFNSSANASGPEPSNAELRVLTEFMDDGGGLFATGDHGSLGRTLCGKVPRARSMRIWEEAAGGVGMNDPRRNDTNRSGADASTDFDDQSDDVPQRIEPKMYQRRQGLWTVSFPHPLLCGPDGVIRVMPDHPHEGECVEPSNTSATVTFDGYTTTEYPDRVGTASRPLPEVIATSFVPAGNTADTKDPTDHQKFGSICAYDGHRAGVGRVVTDATWHHFVNINLVGDVGNPTPAKRTGFLHSAAGQDHLDEIKRYFRNIAVWLSPTPSIHCMNTRMVWDLLWHHRVVEAVSTRSDVSFDLADAEYVFDVGRHARDVLGKHASKCQSRRLGLDILAPHFEDWVVKALDPWSPRPDEAPDPDSIPWTTMEPVLDLAIGGALIALREEFPEPDPEIRDQAERAFDDVVADGVESALDMGLRTADESVEQFTKFRNARGDRTE